MDQLHGQVSVVRNHHSAHVVLHGEFDAPEVDHLWRTLSSLLDDTPELVVVGLANVEFMSSAALTQLVKLRDACVAAGGALVISDSSDCASRLIELAGLAGYLGLESTSEASL